MMMEQRQEVAGMADEAGAKGSHPEPQSPSRESTLGMARGFKTSRLPPSNVLPPTRPELLNQPKQGRQLRTKYPNI